MWHPLPEGPTTHRRDLGNDVEFLVGTEWDGPNHGSCKTWSFERHSIKFYALPRVPWVSWSRTIAKFTPAVFVTAWNSNATTVVSQALVIISLLIMSNGPVLTTAVKAKAVRHALPCNGNVLPSSDPCTDKITIGRPNLIRLVLDLIDNRRTKCTIARDGKNIVVQRCWAGYEENRLWRVWPSYLPQFVNRGVTLVSVKGFNKN